MNERQLAFMTEVLGPVGAKALCKMAERSPALDSALLPRTVLAWLGLVAKYDYEGDLPGVANTYVIFNKSETGFNGSIDIDQTVYGMEHASIYHVAGSVAVALGMEPRQIDPQVKDIDVAKLGKSIDLLAKAQMASKELEKVAAKQAKTKAKPTEKTEGAGLPNKPMEATPPTPPDAPAPAQVGASVPKPPKATLPSLKVTKGEAAKACKACGEPQFQKDRFAGCLCFAGMQKSVKTSIRPDGYLLDFSGGWDMEAIEALIASMKK